MHRPLAIAVGSVAGLTLPSLGLRLVLIWTRWRKIQDDTIQRSDLRERLKFWIYLFMPFCTALALSELGIVTYLQSHSIAPMEARGYVAGYLGLDYVLACIIKGSSVQEVRENFVIKSLLITLILIGGVVLSCLLSLALRVYELLFLLECAGVTATPTTAHLCSLHRGFAIVEYIETALTTGVYYIVAFIPIYYIWNLQMLRRKKLLVGFGFPLIAFLPIIVIAGGIYVGRALDGWEQNNYASDTRVIDCLLVWNSFETSFAMFLVSIKYTFADSVRCFSQLTRHTRSIRANSHQKLAVDHELKPLRRSRGTGPQKPAVSRSSSLQPINHSTA